MSIFLEFIFLAGCVHDAPKAPVPPPLLPAQVAQQKADLQSVARSFVEEYSSLRVPEIEYEYAKNFRNISKKPELEKRIALAKRYQTSLDQLNVKLDDFESYLESEWLRTILVSIIERAELEMKFLNDKAKKIPENGLYSLSNRDEWYAFYVKRYASYDAKPEEIEKVGLSETDRIKGEILKVQSRLGFAGNPQAFHEHLESSGIYDHEVGDVIGKFMQIKNQIQSRMKEQFSDTNTGNLRIAPVKDPDKDTPPGLYYRDQKAFYFSFFQNRFKKRFAEWLFLHEAIPGHHYQYVLQDKARNRPKFAKFSIHLGGFVEGWGAYSETLGSELGLYNDPYSQLGKLEWDLVRSVRLVIDVGIHVRGWNRNQAVDFWRKNIQGQDEIMNREIDRMIRWPVQVISYKMGEAKLIEFKEQMKTCRGKRFDPRKFHKLILERGTMPFSILKLILDHERKLNGC